jgi:parvulin-like peptidyl-prolyl isomerase
MRLAQIVFLRDEKAASLAARTRAERILLTPARGRGLRRGRETDSDDHASGVKGGHVGLVAIESLEGPYRAALENLEVGVVSDIVEDADAFSIFLVNAREGERDATFEDVKDRLTEVLKNQKAKVLYDALLAEAREKTYVETRLDEVGS